MLKNSVLFCLLSVFLFGCKSSSEKGIATVCLTHEEIKLSEMMVGVPGSIQRLGDGLLIMDLKSDSVLHYVDLKEKNTWGSSVPSVKGRMSSFIWDVCILLKARPFMDMICRNWK